MCVRALTALPLAKTGLGLNQQNGLNTPPSVRPGKVGRYRSHLGEAPTPAASGDDVQRSRTPETLDKKERHIRDAKRRNKFTTPPLEK